MYSSFIQPLLNTVLFGYFPLSTLEYISYSVFHSKFPIISVKGEVTNLQIILPITFMTIDQRTLQKGDHPPGDPLILFFGRIFWTLLPGSGRCRTPPAYHRRRGENPFRRAINLYNRNLTHITCSLFPREASAFRGIFAISLHFRGQMSTLCVFFSWKNIKIMLLYIPNMHSLKGGGSWNRSSTFPTI